MAMMIAPLFFRFSCCVVDEYNVINQRLYRIYFWFAFVNALALFFTPYYVKGLWSFGDYRYQPSGGVLYGIFAGFFYLCTVHGFFTALKKYPKLINRKKKQARLFLLGTGIGYFGGGTLFLQAFQLAIPSFGVFLVLGYLISTGYAIHKYKFMDFPKLIRRSVVFAGLFMMAMIVIAIVTEVSKGIVERFFPVPLLIERALNVMVALLLYEPTKKLLVKITDRYLFQKKEEVRVILNRLSQNIITILDIEKVGTTILETLKDSLRLESGVILIRDEDGKAYEIMDSFGVPKTQERFPKEGLFIRYFLESDRILNLEDQAQKDGLPLTVRGVLDVWSAVICMPLFIHRDLIGLLVLGKKKSDQDFSDEELDCFPAVAGQVAIALSNARLYHILMRSQADFAQQAKMAAIGTLSAGISHEIKNPLQVIRGIVEMLRFNKKSGLYNDYTKEKYEELISDALTRMLDAVNRATGVIDRLSSFAKKPKELKTEVFGLEQAMEDALKMVAYEFEQNQIAVEKHYASNLPKVLADRHAIEEVFFNLLINARHAMVEKGTLWVRIEQHGSEIEASIRDTGAGIPEDHLEKIFDPFFTTKDTSRNPDEGAIKGSGLGLFLVREIVKRYGGRIHLESEVGKGTTFHVFLPVSPDL